MWWQSEGASAIGEVIAGGEALAALIGAFLYGAGTPPAHALWIADLLRHKSWDGSDGACYAPGIRVHMAHAFPAIAIAVAARVTSTKALRPILRAAGLLPPPTFGSQSDAADEATRAMDEAGGVFAYFKRFPLVPPPTAATTIVPMLPFPLMLPDGARLAPDLPQRPLP